MKKYILNGYSLAISGTLIGIVTLMMSACSGGGGGSTPACNDTSFYVDSSQGNDSNSGHCDNQPWKTLQKVETTALPLGANIYLKKNDIWYEGLSLPSSNITISSYGTGSNPILDGSAAASRWNSLGNSVYSQTVSLPSGDGLGHVSKNGVVMNFIAWNTDAATTFAAAPLDSFSYDNSSATLYIKVATDPTADSYRFSEIYKGISADGLSNVSLSDLTIRDFSLHGIEYKNCRNCNVSNVTVENIGGATIGTNYAGNGIEYSNTSSAGSVNNVVIQDVFDSCFSPQTYASSQVLSDISISNTTLNRCGFAGIEISVLNNAGTTGSAISNINIDNVIIQDTGKGWSGRRYGTEGHGIRILADVGAGAISATTIRGATISNAAGDGIRIAGDTGVTTVEQSSLDHNAGAGIDVAEPTSATPKLVLTTSLVYSNSGYGVSFNCPYCAGLDLYNNTFYDNGAINLAISGQSNEAMVLNNVFNSSAPMTHIYVNSTLTGGNLDHNCYNDTTNMFGYAGSPYSSVSAFNLATGYEQNGVGNGVVGLTDPANGVFTLDPGSTCIGLGIPIMGVSTDFSGAVYSNPPSAGAFEYQ